MIQLAEIAGLMYLALCCLACGAFVLAVAVTDLHWRLTQRSRTKRLRHYEASLEAVNEFMEAHKWAT